MNEITQHPSRGAPRSIELFAGCGGLALGLHRSGWQGVFAIERDPMAFETLSRNMVEPDAPFAAFSAWPNWMPKQPTDLVELLADPIMRTHLHSLRGTIDLVAGGPPCQGFSVGGKRDGGDVRNQLVYSMLNLVDLVRPRAVLIENVEGITRRFISKPDASCSSVADEVVTRLEDCGYTATWSVINASDFGVPQTRKRVVIIAVRRPNIAATRFSMLVKRCLQEAAEQTRLIHGLPFDRPITVREAIDDLSSTTEVPCPDSPGFAAGTYTQGRSKYSQLMREGINADELPNSHRFSKHGPGITTLYKLAHETQTAGRLPKSFLLDNGTKKDKKVLLDPEKPIATVTTHPDEYIHYLHPRNITVREMARLQSFPDRFHFYGRYTINGPRRRFDVARCSQVGNAVPPLMGEGLGRAILEVLEGIEAIVSQGCQMAKTQTEVNA